MMNPALKKALQNPDYQAKLARRAMHLTDMGKAVKAAGGAAKTQLELEYTNAKQQYDRYDELIKYTISQRAIDVLANTVG